MRAAVCEHYGPPEAVVIEDVPMPVVGARDVLIRVHTSTDNIADARIRAVRVPHGLAIPTRLAMGIFGPRDPVFGLEVAGVVERVGAAVSAFKPGDRVVGGHAELLVVPDTVDTGRKRGSVVITVAAPSAMVAGSSTTEQHA